MKLTIDEKSPIAHERRRHRRSRDFLRFVGVAKQELAGCQRLPLPTRRKLAHALGFFSGPLAILALEHGLTYAIAEAEMLLPRRHKLTVVRPSHNMRRSLLISRVGSGMALEHFKLIRLT